MDSATPFLQLNASEAARRLGVSAKALRLYEQHGLLQPARTPSGYRTYGAHDLARAQAVVSLRALGLSLAQVAQVQRGDARSLGDALAAHEAALDAEIQGVLRKLEEVRATRAGLAQGRLPANSELVRLSRRPGQVDVAFELPWPWGGEWFELQGIAPLNYIIGSLGSGKTRLARRLAETLPQAVFLGLDRLNDAGAAAQARLAGDSALHARVQRTLDWLVDDGATRSGALLALLAGLERDGSGAVVVDMVEQDLDAATQQALIAYLRQRAQTRDTPPLFLMTRSCAILDLAAVGPDEAIILCPANHSPPTRVAPFPGAAGYEAVATCLASPAVRARVAHDPGPH